MLAQTYRSYAWVQPLSAGTPRLWQVDELLSKADRSRAELQASSSSWSLSLPTQELEASKRAATVAGRRLLLVGGEAAALLVAFAVLAAGAMRRDLAAARRRLTWHGAQAWQRALLTGTESAAVGFGGAVVGWLIGIVAGGIVAAASGAPVWGVLLESLLSPTGLLLGLGTAVVAACVIAMTVSVDGGGRRISAIDVAAVAAVLAALGVLASGAVQPDELASGGTAAVVLLVLPGLVAFAAAVAAARLLPALGRTLARGGGAHGARLAGVSLARSPGAAGTAAAFLALALALACLAEAYRSTLSTGERDQAAFAVPADIVVRENLSALVPVLQAAPLSRFEAIPGVETVRPVVRLTASAGPSASVSGVTVLGVAPAALAAMPLWRSDWGASRSGLVRAVEPDGPTALRGPVLGTKPDAVRRSRARLVPGGRPGKGRDLPQHRPRRLGRAPGGGPSDDPRRERDRGGRLVELVLVPPRILERGSDEGTALRGATTLRVQGVSLDDWVGEGGVTAADRADGTVRASYTITPQREALVRPRQPTDEDPPRAVVTRGLGTLAGGVGGTLPLLIGGEPVQVRVGAVVDRIPGTTGDAVVADLDALTTAANTSAPGSAPVSELWLGVADGQQRRVDATLAKRPFNALETRSRAALQADARRDPLGHGTLLALAAAAVAALALAVWGLVLAIRADLRDDRGDLVDLEAQGATPHLLRRVVATRAGVVAGMGVLAGVVAGILLAVLVTRVVSVTARADQPEPPLVTTVDPLILLLGGLVFAVAAAGLVLLTTRNAFVDPRGPGRIGAEP